jgi:hypothetical protein
MECSGPARRHGYLWRVERVDPYISPRGKRINRSRYYCLRCGGFTVAAEAMVRRGHTRSCGCLRRDTARVRMTENRNDATFTEKLVAANHTHGKTDHPLYGRWCGMRTRCSCESTPLYKFYGGRGITVNPRWESFENYLEDMISLGWSEGDTRHMDRIDNDGPYSPGNVRLISKSENSKKRWRDAVQRGTRTVKPPEKQVMV